MSMFELWIDNKKREERHFRNSPAAGDRVEVQEGEDIIIYVVDSVYCYFDLENKVHLRIELKAPYKFDLAALIG